MKSITLSIYQAGDMVVFLIGKTRSILFGTMVLVCRTHTSLIQVVDCVLLKEKMQSLLLALTTLLLSQTKLLSGSNMHSEFFGIGSIQFPAGIANTLLD